MNSPHGLAGLSFMQPITVEPMVKAETAEALALTVPPTLLAIAAEVIK
jgi:hypothetical protein